MEEFLVTQMYDTVVMEQKGDRLPLVSRAKSTCRKEFWVTWMYDILVTGRNRKLDCPLSGHIGAMHRG